MILTNRLRLPRSIENAVRRDPYSRGNADISVTGLISPARKRALEIRHSHKISEDVSERLWALMGQIAHGILDRADAADSVREKRLYIDRYGWMISGQFDRLCLEEDEIDEWRMCLDDYKLTSIYAVKDGCKPEWEAQINIYALMLREHGYTVEKLRVVAILRDWQKSKSKHTPDYPQAPAIIIPVPLWSDAKTEIYIKERLIAHGSAQHDLPQCSSEERWERPGIWAMYKNGNKRATSLHDTEDDALEAAKHANATANGKAAFSVRERPAIQIRCQDYCPAMEFCEQGQRLVNYTEEFQLKQTAWVVSGPRGTAA